MTPDDTKPDDAARLAGQAASTDADAARQALAALERQAAAGDLAAINALATIHSDGVPTMPADPVLAYRYSALAAQAGDPQAMYWKSVLEERAGDVASAYASARAARDAGSAPAAVACERMRLEGIGCTAQPMDALDALSRLAEDSPDAALLLAVAYLDGKRVPRQPQRAYDLLHRHDAEFQTWRFIAPRDHEHYLVRKAQAIRHGARPQAGEEVGGLLERAAADGGAGAQAVLVEWRREETGRRLAGAWGEIASFRAHGRDWTMFHRVGRLVDTQDRSRSAAGTVGGTVHTTTARWTVLQFAAADGTRHEVSVPARTRPPIGRSFVTVYAGPQGSGSGAPVLLVDLEDGSTIRANGTLAGHFDAQIPKTARRLAGLAIGLGVLSGAAGLVDGAFWIATLPLLGAGIVLKRSDDGETAAAIERAAEFVRMHRCELAAG